MKEAPKFNAGDPSAWATPLCDCDELDDEHIIARAIHAGARLGRRYDIWIDREDIIAFGYQIFEWLRDRDARYMRRMRPAATGHLMCDVMVNDRWITIVYCVRQMSICTFLAPYDTSERAPRRPVRSRTGLRPRERAKSRAHIPHRLLEPKAREVEIAREDDPECI